MVPTPFPKMKAILLKASRKSDGDKHRGNHRCCENSLVLLTLQRSSYKHKELGHCLLETARCSCHVDDACIREPHSALASAFQALCGGVGLSAVGMKAVVGVEFKFYVALSGALLCGYTA